jgi:hypothetical protein
MVISSNAIKIDCGKKQEKRNKRVGIEPRGSEG